MMKSVATPVLLASLAALAVAGCAQNTARSGGGPEKRVVAPDYPTAGKTYVFFDRAHGFQLEYFGADGLSWLWYPGNQTVVPGQWRTDGGSICFKYPTASFNPVTQVEGGAWECALLDHTRPRVVALRDGDPYGLERAEAAPYPLDRCAPPDGVRLLKPAGCPGA